MLLHKNIKTCFKRKKTNEIFRDGWDKRDARSFTRWTEWAPSTPSSHNEVALLDFNGKMIWSICSVTKRTLKNDSKKYLFFCVWRRGRGGVNYFCLFFQKILNYRFLFGTLFFQTKLVLFLEASNILSLLSTIFDKCMSALLYIFRWWIYKSNKRDPVIKVIYSIWPIFLKIYVYYVLYK